MKRRATSSEKRKFFVAVVKRVLGIVKKMLTNGGFMKFLLAYVGLARVGKALAVVQGRKIGNGLRNVLFNSPSIETCDQHTNYCSGTQTGK